MIVVNGVLALESFDKIYNISGQAQSRTPRYCSCHCN